MAGYGELALFRGIREEEIGAMLACFRARQGTYRSGEPVCEYDGACREVGVLLTGTLRLVRIDRAGVQTILEHIRPGGVFGEVLGFTSCYGDSLFVVCEEESRVLYLDYGHMMKRCEKACAYHSTLVQNMFSLVTGQIRSLSRRVEVLSRRSIREKLLSYFAIQAAEGGGETFSLPFSLTALADYISADRSAMMRELRRLREEGLVQIVGRRVRLDPESRERISFFL